MRKMIPSEALKNAYLDIETINFNIPRAGWSNYEDEGVTVYYYDKDVSNLDIKKDDVVLLQITTQGADEQIVTLQLLRDGLMVSDCIDGVFTLYCLKNPSTISAIPKYINVKVTIFRCSTL